MAGGKDQPRVFSRQQSPFPRLCSPSLEDWRWAAHQRRRPPNGVRRHDCWVLLVFGVRNGLVDTEAHVASLCCRVSDKLMCGS